MYNQNFRNQAVKEIKNGSSINGAAKKFGVSPATMSRWINDYEKRIIDITGVAVASKPPVVSPVNARIELQSIKVLINGTAVVLKQVDVLKMLQLFDMFEGAGGERE